MSSPRKPSRAGSSKPPQPKAPQQPPQAQAKKAQRRSELLLAARDVFAEKGYAAATVDDIVARAGAARGTFYLYFKDKRDVFGALVDDFFARLAMSIRSIDVAHPTETPVEQLRANLHRIVSLALSEPALMTLVLRDVASLAPELGGKLDAFYVGLHQLLDESFELGQRIGLVRDGDRRVMVAIGLGGLKELVYDAVRGAMPRSAEVLVDEMMRFLAMGLLAPPPSSAPLRTARALPQKR